MILDKAFFVFLVFSYLFTSFQRSFPSFLSADGRHYISFQLFSLLIVYLHSSKTKKKQNRTMVLFLMRTIPHPRTSARRQNADIELFVSYKSSVLTVRTSVVFKIRCKGTKKNRYMQIKNEIFTYFLLNLTNDRFPWRFTA